MHYIFNTNKVTLYLVTTFKYLNYACFFCLFYKVSMGLPMPIACLRFWISVNIKKSPTLYLVYNTISNVIITNKFATSIQIFEPRLGSSCVWCYHHKHLHCWQTPLCCTWLIIVSYTKHYWYIFFPSLFLWCYC